MLLTTSFTNEGGPKIQWWEEIPTNGAIPTMTLIQAPCIA